MPAVELLMALRTQWRTNGATGAAMGLDYAAVMPTLRLMGVARARWAELFDDLRVMEEAALKALREGA